MRAVEFVGDISVDADAVGDLLVVDDVSFIDDVPLVVVDLECILIIDKLVVELKLFSITVDVFLMFSGCDGIMLAIGVANSLVWSCNCCRACGINVAAELDSFDLHGVMIVVFCVCTDGAGKVEVEEGVVMIWITGCSIEVGAGCTVGVKKVAVVAIVDVDKKNPVGS